MIDFMFSTHIHIVDTIIIVKLRWAYAPMVMKTVL
jgi:hypothetical protein